MQHGHGPEHGHGYQQQYPQQHQAPPTKPKRGVLGWLALIVGGSLLACAGLGAIGAIFGPKDPGAPKTVTRSVATPEAPGTVQLLPWVAEVQANCERYKAAPNEIKKSAIFTENQSFLAKTQLSNVRGKLQRLSTDQGGNELRLVVEVGDAEFKTETLFAPIKKGSDVYNAAAELTEGQCVIVSADKIDSASLVEQSKVCDLDYFANFTAIGGC